MAYSSRSMSSHMRQTSTSGGVGPSVAGKSLQARVNQKKEELESLKELRELSAAVANQMEALEQRLATLSDGTEAIAIVMANWHNVLRAINMASAKLPKPSGEDQLDSALPQTLVRIPTEHAPALQAQADLALEEEQG